MSRHGRSGWFGLVSVLRLMRLLGLDSASAGAGRSLLHRQWCSALKPRCCPTSKIPPACENQSPSLEPRFIISRGPEVIMWRLTRELIWQKFKTKTLKPLLQWLLRNICELFRLFTLLPLSWILEFPSFSSIYINIDRWKTGKTLIQSLFRCSNTYPCQWVSQSVIDSFRFLRYLSHLPSLRACFSEKSFLFWLLCLAAYNFEVSNIGRRSIWELFPVKLQNWDGVHLIHPPLSTILRSILITHFCSLQQCKAFNSWGWF